jgi:hypothetical protein
VVCEFDIPQILYLPGSPAKSILNAGMTRDGVPPLLHHVSNGVDVLPRNGHPADVFVDLRQADGSVKQARFTFDYRPDALGSKHDCFFDGTLTSSASPAAGPQ